MRLPAETAKHGGDSGRWCDDRPRYVAERGNTHTRSDCRCCAARRQVGAPSGRATHRAASSRYHLFAKASVNDDSRRPSHVASRCTGSAGRYAALSDDLSGIGRVRQVNRDATTGSTTGQPRCRSWWHRFRIRSFNRVVIRFDRCNCRRLGVSCVCLERCWSRTRMR
jgi:hypothetical protein